MHSKRIRLKLFACLSSLLLLSLTGALATTPLPTPTPPVVIEPLPTPPGEESFPVVINYGQGETTRVSIYRGLMEPVGVLPNQVVTVTISFPTSMAGAPVKLGLYDGGAAGPAPLPGQDLLPSISCPSCPPLPIPPVPVNGSLQFNFQAGRTLGLYRVQMNVGSGQYLLRFYAGRPTADPIPVPSPTLAPTPN
jgi:hypothetical protein